MSRGFALGGTITMMNPSPTRPSSEGKASSCTKAAGNSGFLNTPLLLGSHLKAVCPRRTRWPRLFRSRNCRFILVHSVIAANA